MQSLHKKIQLAMIINVILLSMLSIQNIQAPTNVVTLPLWKTRNPEMDGDIAEGPWRDGLSKDIVLYNTTQDDTLTISITTIHTLTRTFYMGVRFPFYLENNTNFICTLVFRTNLSEPIWSSIDTLGNEHDVKEITIEQNGTLVSRDLHTEKIGDNISLVEDISNDFTSLYHNGSDAFTLEIAIPFESLDVTGEDINPRIQKKIDLFIAIQYDSENYGNFSQYRFEDEDYDFCTIKYREMRQGSFYILLFGIPMLIIATINVGRLIITRKEKS